MRILRYRGNSYASPEPSAEAPRPGARSYRWVKYAIETNKVVPPVSYTHLTLPTTPYV